MKKSLFILTFASLGLAYSGSASAQNAILAEMYGRGVHAHYAGNSSDAKQFLSSAINSGSEDPRTYYFRGIVAYREGRTYEAESDWQRGAQLEASGKTNGAIGRSLSRFQGSGRLKLEQIRQKARLQALTMQAARSQQRLGEIRSSGGLGAAAPMASVPSTPAPPAVVPPPTPPSTDNPFGDEKMADGEAKVVADDALEGAMDNPFSDEPAAAAAGGDTSADNNPFGGDSGDNPFGGDSGGDAMDDNPFGDDSGGDAMGGVNPFGDDNPFGE
jgi:hypothetical protein